MTLNEFRCEVNAKSGGATELAPLRFVSSSTSGAGTPYASERNQAAEWLRYLERLAAKGVTTTAHTAFVRQTWKSIKLTDGLLFLRVPSSIFTADKTVQLSWSNQAYRLEIDFEPMSLDWLCIERSNGRHWGSEVSEREPSANLLKALLLIQ
jgi:hypothetical protein